METDEYYNSLRCYAHELIIKLYNAKRVEALQLLKQHCERALEEIAKAESEGG